MSTSLVECIPNISEGLDNELIARCKQVIESVSGVQFLHQDTGVSAGRTVFTFIGAPESIMEAAFQLYQTVQHYKDMRSHEGVHINIGAVDVCPFVPYANIDVSELNTLVEQLAKRLQNELGISGYFYEQSGREINYAKLETIRKGGYTDNEYRFELHKPDFGPGEYDPKFGLTVLGVRNFLIAYNINLKTNDVSTAEAIAKVIRTSGFVVDGQRLRGIFPALKAVGWYLEDFDQVQVSTNITDFHKNGMLEVFDAVKKMATELNTEVTGSELIGMIPKQYLIETGQKLDGVEPIQTAIDYLGLSDLSEFNASEKIIEEKLRG